MPSKQPNLTQKKQHKESWYRGVYHTKNGWVTKITINRKNNTYGPFSNETDAAMAYDRKALDLYKEKAILNILENPFPKPIPKPKPKKKKKKKSNIHERGKISMVTRNKICSKQGWKCNFCDDQFKENIEIDHIIPLFLGGPNDTFNLQGLCVSCHKFKSSLLDNQVLKPLSQSKILTINDVLQIQRDHYHKVTCTQPSVVSNINCQQYITNSNVSLSGNDKKLELSVNGIKIDIHI